ncbi:hypothetical protein L3Y34_010878 [Caenorhabditis briggsae]|uniref:TNFR-Cys domain-containing protein n=2 Tax=Caenorhabditis briggsae TaxID=6238 RepID=A0AAE8ZMK0_CAEBR|nr:hypothetical protein L3Y34_010878 [Caenorhabditis briggsae]
MRNAMRVDLKLLVFFCLVSWGAAAIYGKELKCPADKYRFKNSCFNCTPCGDFMYEREKCSAFSNTICGWCGKKPNLDEISDSVLASYQTKCLMSNLDFVGMTPFLDERFNYVVDGREESQESGDTSESQEHESLKDSSENNEFENFKKAYRGYNFVKESKKLENFKKAYNDFEFAWASLDSLDSSEQESGEESSERHSGERESRLRDSGEEYSEEKDSGEKKSVEYESGEKESSELADPTIAEGDDSGFEYNQDRINEIDEQSQEDAEYAADQELLTNEELINEDQLITKEVGDYLVKKGHKVKEPELRIVKLKDIGDSFPRKVPDVPFMMTRRRLRSFESSEEKFDLESAEDSNDRLIEWKDENWLDDSIKRIPDSVEIVQAEEITEETYEIFPRKAPRTMTIEERRDLIERLSVELDNEGPSRLIDEHRPPFTLSMMLRPAQLALYAVILAFVVFVFTYLHLRAKARKQAFTGVPLDSPDYHLIVDASKYIEELEKKEKHASRHVHENPIFDI